MSQRYSSSIEFVRDAGFPTVKQLRRGITLHCIATSFWFAAHDPVGYVFWEDSVYFEDQMQGEQWAACFAEQGVVVVFYSTESTRNPFPAGRPPYDPSRFFLGMPDRLRPAKDQALALMGRMGLELNDSGVTAITTAMWAEDARFTAAEDWAGVYRHSTWACYRHLLPPRLALQEWWNGMDFPVSGRRAAWSLYQRRRASKDSTIRVESWEREEFTKLAGRPRDAVKWESAVSLLASVGIRM